MLTTVFAPSRSRRGSRRSSSWRASHSTGGVVAAVEPAAETVAFLYGLQVPLPRIRRRLPRWRVWRPSGGVSSLLRRNPSFAVADAPEMRHFLPKSAGISPHISVCHLRITVRTLWVRSHVFGASYQLRHLRVALVAGELGVGRLLPHPSSSPCVNPNRPRAARRAAP